MGDFTAELGATLSDQARHGETYWSTLLEDDGIEHITSKILDQHRWYLSTLDVYRRTADGALAGILWDAPATEEQEGQDRNPQAVPVEAFTRTDYRIVR